MARRAILGHPSVTETDAQHIKMWSREWVFLYIVHSDESMQVIRCDDYHVSQLTCCGRCGPAWSRAAASGTCASRGTGSEGPGSSASCRTSGAALSAPGGQQHQYKTRGEGTVGLDQLLEVRNSVSTKLTGLKITTDSGVRALLLQIALALYQSKASELVLQTETVSAPIRLR